MSPVPSKEPIKVLAGILKQEMVLPDGQIMLGLENWEIPKNPGLYIALFYGPDTVVGQDNVFDPATTSEVQTVAMMHEIAIEAMSFDSSARTRKQEIVQALNSVFAQQELEDNLMKISGLPDTFLPVPSLEETKWLNRFRISFHMNALYQKTKAVEYYNTFVQPMVTPDQ
jgi:hypothetical protein